MEKRWTALIAAILIGLPVAATPSSESLIVSVKGVPRDSGIQL